MAARLQSISHLSHLFDHFILWNYPLPPFLAMDPKRERGQVLDLFYIFMIMKCVTMDIYVVFNKF
jgi:hypothetical protein